MQWGRLSANTPTWRVTSGKQWSNRNIMKHKRFDVCEDIIEIKVNLMNELIKMANYKSNVKQTRLEIGSRKEQMCTTLYTRCNLLLSAFSLSFSSHFPGALSCLHSFSLLSLINIFLEVNIKISECCFLLIYSFVSEVL